MSRQQDLTRKYSLYLTCSSWMLVVLLSACLPQIPASDNTPPVEATATDVFAPIAFTERPAYSPGEKVVYTAQSGDNLSNLAYRFNTTKEEILAENPIIPEDATTLPPGLPMIIPIYYEALWGSQFQILPNCTFINGPSLVDFDI